MGWCLGLGRRRKKRISKRVRKTKRARSKQAVSLRTPSALEREHIPGTDNIIMITASLDAWLGGDNFTARTTIREAVPVRASHGHIINYIEKYVGHRCSVLTRHSTDVLHLSSIADCTRAS